MAGDNPSLAVPTQKQNKDQEMLVKETITAGDLCYYPKMGCRKAILQENEASLKC